MLVKSNKPSFIRRFEMIFVHKLVRVLPDRLYLTLLLHANLGYWPHIKNPRSFNEKLQWLKLYAKCDDYTKMVDKAKVKDYVKSIIGDEYIIPTIGIWKELSDIDWNRLPPKFVIKSTNDSGGVVVCKDRSTFNEKEAIRKLSVLGSRDYTLYTKEYPYKNVPHCFIAEEYICDDNDDDLKDYKFFCFDGEPKFLFVATGRQKNDTRFDFYDTNFCHLPVLNGHPNAKEMPTKPLNFDIMLEIAKKLSQNIPHVRVDLYNVNGKVYFGELTFFHWSGIVPFEPIEWDFKFGDYLKLPRV